MKSIGIIFMLSASFFVNSCLAINTSAYAFKTCAKKFGNGDPAEEYRLLHMQLIDQEQDQCFAKCLWMDSNQYNEETNAIVVSEIVNLLTSKGIDVPKHLLELTEPTDGSCEALFAKTRTFVQRELSNNYEEE